MARWGMVVDLRKCVGCATCRDVCTRIKEIPAASNWRKVIEVNHNGVDNDSANTRFYVSMGCMHCTNPPCLEVCPTKATYSRPDGIIDIQKDLCVGCGACIVACPYHARSICGEDRVVTQIEAPHRQSGAPHEYDDIGTCTKCDFCRQRVDEGKAKGLQPGIDSAATPLCVQFCIAGALYFGDLDDEHSEVSQLIRKNQTSRLLKEMDTDPKVYYILK